MRYVWLVLAGLLLTNAIPHLAAGLRGERFRTPFADPPGKGLSSAGVNVAWGWANVALGLAALSAAFRWSLWPEFAALLIPALLGGLWLSRVRPPPEG